MEGDRPLGAIGCSSELSPEKYMFSSGLGAYPRFNLNPKSKGVSQTAVLGQLFLQNAHKYSSMKARMGGSPIPRAATIHLPVVATNCAHLGALAHRPGVIHNCQTANCEFNLYSRLACLPGQR